MNHKRILMVGIVILLFISLPGSVEARWPPFTFRLTPTHHEGQITYDIWFVDRLDGVFTDLTIKVPVPEGTRYVKGSAQATTEVRFDGEEVTFFSAFLDRRSIRVASFTVEITDPEQTVFTTQPWLSWEGDLPGDYLANEVSIDISEPPPLDWTAPPRSRFHLEAKAVVMDDVITYEIYPINWRGRIWDADIKLPLPPGTTLLNVETSYPFVDSFDGREVTFFASELEFAYEVEPLRVQVSTLGVEDPIVVTHVWAGWKNVGRAVTRRQPLHEDTRTGDMVVQPHATQWVMPDDIGDTPFGNYDLATVAIEKGEDAFDFIFYTVDSIGPVGEPLIFIFYINNDCRGGLDYQAVYTHYDGHSWFQGWNDQKRGWNDPQPIEAVNPGPRLIRLRVPFALFQARSDTQEFCGVGRAQNLLDVYSRPLPDETAPTRQIWEVSRYKAALFEEIPLPSIPTTLQPVPTPAPSRQPTPSLSPTTDPTGQLAVPIDDGLGRYDVHIFSIPEGRLLDKIPNARQPNFRYDGERLVVNREGGGLENLYEYDLTNDTERQVSDSPTDSHPFYDPWGNRLVYGNAALTVGSAIFQPDGEDEELIETPRKPFIFVQCSLLPPHQETEPRCQDIAGQGMLVPAGLMGEIQGAYPVWTGNDRIAFNGCNSWSGFGLCGIYTVSAGSTRGFSQGSMPVQLTRDSTDIPSDTEGDLLAFTSQRDGNWEAYLIHLNGSGLTNLSNSPYNDGLPTISPDRQWVAFVSDRSGQWAVWLVPVGGGEPLRLFDLPDDPWGRGDRAWIQERISWGGQAAEPPPPQSAVPNLPTPDYYELYTPTPNPDLTSTEITAK